MIDYAYYNGIFTPYDSACIPFSDRSIFFGDAVYDVVIGRGKKAYQLDLHLDRLYRNAERIGLMELPRSSEIYEVVDTLLAESSADEFTLYLQFSAGSRRRNHARVGKGANTLITVTHCDIPTALEAVIAITLPDNRHGLCDVKTVGLLPAVLSVEEAQRRDADIAIFHKNGTVTECSYANLSILTGGTLITHPYNSEILPGITQANLISLCKEIGIPHVSRPFSVNEMFCADAVLMTSTTKLIKICTEVDKRPLQVSCRDLADRLFEGLRANFEYEILAKNV